MKLKDITKYPDKALKIVITLSIIIFIIAFLQAIYVEISKSYHPAENCRSRTKRTGKDWDIKRASKNFLPDGTVLLTTLKKARDIKTEKVYDANYALLWEGTKNARPEKYNYLEWATSKRHGFSVRNLKERQQISPELGRFLEIPVRKDNQISEVWRYLPAKNIFVGYEYSGAKIGYLGVNGVVKLKILAGPIGQPTSIYGVMPCKSETPMLVWQMENQLLKLDFENRKVEIIIDAGDKKISNLKYHLWSFSDNGSDNLFSESQMQYRSLMCYQTDKDSMNLVLRGPDEKITIQLPEKLKKKARENSCQIAATKDNIFLCKTISDFKLPENFHTSRKVREAFWANRSRDKEIHYSKQLYKLESDGNLELVNKFDWTRPEITQSQSLIVYEDPQMRYLKQATVFSPTVFSPVIRGLEHIKGMNYYSCIRQFNGATRGYLELIDFVYPRNMLINISLSAVMMVIALYHGCSRRTSWAGLGGWLVLIGLFNLAGLLTYLALNHSPLIKCSVCGKWRGLKMPLCIHCKASLPVPADEPLVL
ncbi:MAG: hypothetical protein K8R02_00925 [Anaerohalosphaeraceae bacterium]|nr:hypothetical protein [Anaerohalosphaeraceae bacterium]